MPTLASQPLRRALTVLGELGEGCVDGADFARRGVVLLPRLVASELTTLSVCELDTGHRSVVSDAPGGIGAAQVQAFDRHFHEHPLVRAHGQRGDRVTRTIDELVDARSFRRSPLYADYYRVIGIDHVLALPLHVDRTRLVSFVLNRRGRRFSVEECALLECMRPTLAALYRAHAGTALPASVAAAACAPLTDREREVMRWVSAGKTNRDIAEILGARVRTVEKHLERVYAKLGVETRTAAAMRWRAGS